MATDEGSVAIRRGPEEAWSGDERGTGCGPRAAGEAVLFRRVAVGSLRSRPGNRCGGEKGGGRSLRPMTEESVRRRRAWDRLSSASDRGIGAVVTRPGSPASKSMDGLSSAGELFRRS